MNKNTIKIPIPPLFSYSECLWFLDRNYDDCVYTLKQEEIWKAIRIDNDIYLIKIYTKKNTLHVEIIIGPVTVQSKKIIKEYVIEWFDINRNLEQFYKLLNNDPQLSYMSKEFSGLRLMGIEDLFEALCWCVIGQQINLSFAYKLKRRLVERYGTIIHYEGESFYLFPDFRNIASASIEELKQMQFSTRKAEYIIGIAKAFSEGSISIDLIQQLPDIKSKQEVLLNIRGIGMWTANYVLMKTLKELSSIPVGDIGLINSLLNHKIIKEKNDVNGINRFFKKYRGWESYVVIYLWRSLAVKKKI